MLERARVGDLDAYCVAKRKKVNFATGNARINRKDNKRTGHTVMICGNADCANAAGEPMRICRIIGIDKY